MFNISFNFDEVTKKVTNLNVSEIKEKSLLKEGSFVTLVDNKLTLTPDAVVLLGLTAGDRVEVGYYQENNECTYPVIGKVTDGISGNKLTKSNSISYRGDQAKMLANYGTTFKLEEHKSNYYKMIAIEDNEESEESLVEDAKSDLELFSKTVDLIGEQTEDLPL